MSEAEFCCDEGQYLADKLQYENERKAQSCDNRIANQREEIRRLHNHIRNLEQSRNAWKAKAERLGKQNKELLERHFSKKPIANIEKDYEGNIFEVSYRCPVCTRMICFEAEGDLAKHYPYCNCGQALDWGDTK